MMNGLQRMSDAGVVPVVVLSSALEAVPTAKALLEGGIDVMEITFRTACAAEAIRLVSAECPEMLVGAGTILTLEQCKTAVECGARFIVSPGYDEETVTWCCENSLPITPGCVTPSEIMAAMRHRLKVIKFFPANIYGGLKAIKALSGPFPGLYFLPTGGVNAENLQEYANEPCVWAVGGSWLCAKQDIMNGDFDRITALSREAHEKWKRCRG